LVISFSLISQDTQDEAHDGRPISVLFFGREMASEPRNVKEMASEPRNTNAKTREMEAGASDRGGPDEGWIGDDHRGYATYCQLALRSDLLLRRWMRRWWQWIQRRAELRGGRSRGTGRHRRPQGRLKV